MRKTLFTYLALLFVSLSAGAETFFVKGSPELASLDNESIYSIYQDIAGAVWINTSSGLLRFNGTIIEHCHDAMPMRPIVHEEGYDCFFCQDLEKIYRFNIHTRSCTEMNTDGVDVRHSSLASRGGVLHLADSTGIWRITTDSAPVLLLKCSEGSYTLLRNLPSAGFVAATSSGRLVRITDSYTESQICELGDDAREIFEDSHGVVWTGLENNGVLRIENICGEVKTTRIQANDKAKRFRTFCEDNERGILTGCLGGLYRIEAGSNELQQLRGYTPDGHSICSLMKDRDSNIWAGTFYSGIFFCQYDVTPFSSIGLDKTRDFRLVNSLAEDASGDIYAATDGYGMYRINDGGVKEIGPVHDAKMKAVFYDRADDALWTGEYMGPLRKYSRRSGRWSEYQFNDDGHGSGRVFGIARFGNDLWLQGSDFIYLFNPDSETVVWRTLPGFTGRAQCLRQMTDGDIWIGGPGLSKYHHGKVEKISDLDGAICYDIRQGRNCVWLGTSSGVIKCTPAGLQLNKYNRKNSGLADNLAYRIETLPDGRIIVGTNSGISIIDDEKGLCYNYNRSNGLDLSSVQEGCILKLSDGRILISGTDGIVEYTGQTAAPFHPAGTPSFDKLLVNNLERKISEDGRLVLRYNDNNISIQLADFDYSRIVPSFYECRLEGAERDWTSFDIRLPIVYMRLHPGKYTLQVRSHCGTGTGSPAQETSLRIIVRHPWWWSPVAWILYIAIFVITGRWQYRMYREYMSRKRSRKSENILSIAKTNNDADFLKKAVEVIGAHMSDQEFSVESLSREMAVSYTVLANRMKEITGYSPRDFVEFLRLRKASELLLKGDMNISQVAAEVGFNSSRYFATRFKKQFDRTPSEFIAENIARD